MSCYLLSDSLYQDCIQPLRLPLDTGTESGMTVVVVSWLENILTLLPRSRKMRTCHTSVCQYPAVSEGCLLTALMHANTFATIHINPRHSLAFQ